MDINIIESLGLTVGENFKIRGSGNKIFWMNADGFFYRYEDDKKRKPFDGCYDTLGQIILHPELIIRRKWKPYKEGYYFYVKQSGSYEPFVTGLYWVGSDDDLLNYSIGNCFGTQKEAEAFIPKFIEWRKKVKNKIELDEKEW